MKRLDSAFNESFLGFVDKYKTPLVFVGSGLFFLLWSYYEVRESTAQILKTFGYLGLVTGYTFFITTLIENHRLKKADSDKEE